MKSISIIGPESSGKTTLSILLSKILKGKYVDEYAREYLNNKKKYSISDLDKIALNKQFEFLNFLTITCPAFLHF